MDGKNKDVLFYLLKKYTVLLHIQNGKANERKGERGNLAICGTDQTKCWQRRPDRISDQDKLEYVWGSYEDVVESKCIASKEKSAVVWVPLQINIKDAKRLISFLCHSSLKLYTCLKMEHAYPFHYYLDFQYFALWDRIRLILICSRCCSLARVGACHLLEMSV